MRIASCSILAVLLAAGLAAGQKDGSNKAVDRVAPARKSAASPAPAPAVTPEAEAEAMAFVRAHHPELAAVLETLKPMNPAEYGKAVGEISGVARSLAEVKARNPRRYEFALATWQAKSRVDLLAAQLAGSPSEEGRSRLRSAIEARVDVEIRRHKSDLEQAELAAKKAREAIDRLESRRDEIVEARLRALQPRKAPKSRPGDPAGDAKPATSTTNGGTRR